MNLNINRKLSRFFLQFRGISRRSGCGGNCWDDFLHYVYRHNSLYTQPKEEEEKKAKPKSKKSSTLLRSGLFKRISHTWK